MDEVVLVLGMGVENWGFAGRQPLQCWCLEVVMLGGGGCARVQ